MSSFSRTFCDHLSYNEQVLTNLSILQLRITNGRFFVLISVLSTNLPEVVAVTADVKLPLPAMVCAATLIS